MAKTKAEHNNLFEILIIIQELLAKKYSNVMILKHIRENFFTEDIAYDSDELQELISMCKQRVYSEYYEKENLDRAIALNELAYLYRSIENDNRLKLDILKESNKVRGLDRQKLDVNSNNNTNSNINLTYTFTDDNTDV